MTNESDNVPPQDEQDLPTYRLSVVVKTGKNQFMDRHVDLRVRLPIAKAFLETVRRRGFMTEGERIFPDQIESLQLYERQNDETQRSVE